MNTNEINIMKCPYCGIRPAGTSEVFRCPNTTFFCDICERATAIVHTSVDDARESIKNCGNVDVIYMAIKMASMFQQKTRLGMLHRRLNKLTEFN